MLSLLLAVPSCIYIFWHGIIPSSYFIFILVHNATYAVHGFRNVSFNVIEGETLDTSFGLNVKGVTRFPSLVLSGDIHVEEDTASM